PSRSTTRSISASPATVIIRGRAHDRSWPALPWSPRPDVLFDPVAAAHPVHRLAVDPASARLTTICVVRGPGAGRPAGSCRGGLAQWHARVLHRPQWRYEGSCRLGVPQGDHAWARVQPARRAPVPGWNARTSSGWTWKVTCCPGLGGLRPSARATTGV